MDTALATIKTEELSDVRIKKLLSDPKYRIELHDLVHDETDKVYRLIEKSKVSGFTNDNILKSARGQIDEFEAGSKNLIRIMAYGGYFGLDGQTNLWTHAMDQLANIPHNDGSTFLLHLRLYPAILALYSDGLTSLASKRYYNLGPLLQTQERKITQATIPLIVEANCTLLNAQQANTIFENKENRYTPLSDHLHDLLADSLPKGIIFNNDFDSLFDKFEVIIAMAVADYTRDKPMGPWAPLGRFAWRNHHIENEVLGQIKAEVTEAGDNWELLKVGLFGGSLARAKAALSYVEQAVTQGPW